MHECIEDEDWMNETKANVVEGVDVDVDAVSSEPYGGSGFSKATNYYGQCAEQE